MNLVLFSLDEIGRPLPRTDTRARHILEVLRRQPGDRFDAGVVGGRRGKAVLVSVAVESLGLEFEWTSNAEPADPMVLLVGLPRPQIARRILRDAPGLGLQALHFFQSGKGERSYVDSSLWSSGEWRTQLADGAAQAFDTRLPEVTAGRTLADLVGQYRASRTRIALDPYEAAGLLSGSVINPATEPEPIVLALGPERGWSADERNLLRDADFTLASLGKRILRTETACVAAVSVVKGKIGLL